MIGIMVDFQFQFQPCGTNDLCDPDLDSKPSDRGPSDLGTWESLWIQTIQSKVMAS